MVNETQKIMHDDDIAISATCVRVPVFTGHSESVHAEFTRPMSPDDAERILAETPGIKILNDTAISLYPQPWSAGGTDAAQCRHPELLADPDPGQPGAAGRDSGCTPEHLRLDRVHGLASDGKHPGVVVRGARHDLRLQPCGGGGPACGKRSAHLRRTSSRKRPKPYAR